MKLLPNAGGERVVDELRECIGDDSRLDLATSAFSLFAFAELRDLLQRLAACRIVLPGAGASDIGLLGAEADRSLRNRLLVPSLARSCREWLTQKAEVREAPGPCRSV